MQALAEDPEARRLWNRLETHGEWVAAYLTHLPGGPMFVRSRSCCAFCGRDGWLIPVLDVAGENALLLCWVCLKTDGGR